MAMLLGNGNGFSQFFSKQLLVGQLRVVLSHLNRTIFIEHQVFNVLRIALGA